MGFKRKEFIIENKKRVPGINGTIPQYSADESFRYILSDIQCGVISPVNRIGDRGYSCRIADHADKGSCVLKFRYQRSAGSLTQSADHAAAFHENFLSISVHADHAFRCDANRPEAGVD